MNAAMIKKDKPNFSGRYVPTEVQIHQFHSRPPYFLPVVICRLNIATPESKRGESHPVGEGLAGPSQADDRFGME